MYLPLTTHHYNLTIKFRDPAQLPPYGGSMIRGAFGHILKRISCVGRQTAATTSASGRTVRQPLGAPSCPACEVASQCVYALTFESFPFDTGHFGENAQVPRPYIFEPPADDRTDYGPGDKMTFGLTLIGKAKEFLPYYIVSFSEMGHEGITRRRSRFSLQSVTAANPLTGETSQIYSSEDKLVRNQLLPVTGDHINIAVENMTKGCRMGDPSASPQDDNASPQNDDIARLTINFLTPTRITYQKQLQRSAPPFPALIQSLCLRLPMLSYFHCGHHVEADFRKLVAEAQAVRIAAADTSWHRISRYSNRQQKKDTLSGLVGSVTYAADSPQNLAPYLPLLIWGTFTHVGKKAVFGLGKYSLDMLH